MDYYAILGVHPTAEDIVIRAAYKALAQRYHPDRFPGSKDEAHRRMSDLTKAYEVLADPVRRPKYDRRRVAYTQSFAARFNGAPKYASPAQAPDDLRSAGSEPRKVPRRVLWLMIVVVVLSDVQPGPLFDAAQGLAGNDHADGTDPVRTRARRDRRARCGAAGAKLDDCRKRSSTRPKPAYQSKRCICRGIGCAQTATAGAPVAIPPLPQGGVGERIRKSRRDNRPPTQPSCGCAATVPLTCCGKGKSTRRRNAPRSPGKEPTHGGGIGSLRGYSRRVGPMQSEHDREEEMT